MSQAISERAVEGVELPPVGTWVFDKGHTNLEFVARHMLSRVRGRFTEFDGSVKIAERPEDSSVEVEIRAESIQTNSDYRDNHLKSEDFLQSETYPVLTFHGAPANLTRDELVRLCRYFFTRHFTVPLPRSIGAAVGLAN
jgi:polyisoprenoid-binding protein YceI